MIASPVGAVSATQTPLTARRATSVQASPTSPLASEATAKPSSAHRYTRRGPSAAATRPPSTTEAPNPTANAVISQLAPAGVRPSPVPTEGIATTMMDTSRASSSMLPDSRSSSAQRRELQVGDDIDAPWSSPARAGPDPPAWCVRAGAGRADSAQQRAAAGVDEGTGHPAGVRRGEERHHVADIG